MSQLLLQVVIVVAFSAFCFGGGYLTAFIVTRNQWRDEMIKRGVARYNWQTGLPFFRSHKPAMVAPPTAVSASKLRTSVGPRYAEANTCFRVNAADKFDNPVGGKPRSGTMTLLLY
jgi:hypothetical protein